ncbi:MAG: diphthamide biosynthesis enzyme Dph2 [Candidatus Anstonellales archaeon]
MKNKRILLQFPEGLKKFALLEAEKYQKEGYDVFISAKPCYGACDLLLYEAKILNVNKIIHFGHNKFVKKKLDIEVEYIPWRIDVELEKIIDYKSIFENKSVIILTTVQHSHQINYMKEKLSQLNCKVFSDVGYFAIEEGQILGCDCLSVEKILSKQKIDIILYIGSGTFHIKALAYTNNEKLFDEIEIYSYDPFDNKLEKRNEEIKRLYKKRLLAIAQFVHAKNIGIVISTKVGQFYLNQAKLAKKRLNKLGKNCFYLIADELYDHVVKNVYGLDGILNTACPRIVDDQEKFGLPIINYKDLFLVEEMFERISDRRIK